VRKEVEHIDEVELWALYSFISPHQWQWCQQLGVMVVWQDPVLVSASVFPLYEEGDMVEEPPWVDEDTI
jgi:hypothetical protein